MKKLDPELQATRDHAKVLGVGVLVLLVVPLAIGLPISWLSSRFNLDGSLLLFFVLWVLVGVLVLWADSRDRRRVDTSDIPEVPADWFKTAKLSYPERALASQSFFYCANCKRPKPAWRSCDLVACPVRAEKATARRDWSFDDEERIG